MNSFYKMHSTVENKFKTDFIGLKKKIQKLSSFIFVINFFLFPLIFYVVLMVLYGFSNFIQLLLIYLFLILVEID